MPLIRVDLDRTLFEEKGDQIGAAIHEAQFDTIKVAEDDLFQVFHPHDAGEIKFDPAYGGVDRRSLMVIQVIAVHKHSVAVKRELYRAIVHNLGAIGIRPEDILIAIIENGFEDWYAGKL
jgi:hypothetical protein